MKDTVKIEKGRVLMVAHRGVSGIECENTNAAFVAAANRSYFGIETDVHVTKDGKYVLFHDDNTERVSGVSMIVEESNWEDLCALRLHEKDGTEREDLVIPQLVDYIKICKKYGKVAVLELKRRMTYEQITEIVDIIKGEEYLDEVIFISFSFDNLVDLRKIVPGQAAQFLTGHLTDEVIERISEHKFDLDVYYEELNAEWMEKLHSRNITVNCWTCDSPERAAELIAMGVDQITSNILE